MQNQESKSIFDKLFDKKICFAVGVGVNTFKGCGIDMYSRDYFILIHQKDLCQFPKKTFTVTSITKQIYERELNISEIEEFKTITDRFNKVIHNQYGRIYELKDSSLSLLRIHKNKVREALLALC